MLNEMLNHLTALGGAVGLMGIAYFAWLVSGVGNMAVKDSLKNWSWKRFGKDLLKMVCFVVSMAACSIVTDGLGYYVDKLQIEQLSAFADVVGWGVVILIPIMVGYYLLYRAIKNNKSLVNYEDAAKLIGVNGENIKITDNSSEIAEKIYQFFDTPKEVVEAQKEFEKEVEKHSNSEEEGGLGAHYSVPYGTYDEFRNTVNGKGYDCDGSYGAQCWDGADLLWMQLGRFLSTGGTGAARGCWTAAKDANAGNDFTLIYDKNSVKRGDVVVFNCGTYGHIGFADANYDGGAYIRLLGQNQGGTAYPSGGASFNVINMSMATFLGAFRFKKWIVTPPTPTPTPTPTVDFKVGDTVTLTNWVDYSGRALMKTRDYYYISELNGDRAVLRADSMSGAVYAAVKTSNLKKVTATPAPTPAPTPSNEFHVGDVVVPTKLVDYNGTPLVQYDDTYTITQINGDRAVLSARGAVWAAMNTKNIRKA